MPIFPIHDGRALSHVERPYATWTIIAVNVVIYFFVEGGAWGRPSFAAVYGFGLIPATYNDYFELPADLAIAAPD
ncbi:MAG TPA: rhomboid family intramembrane serine protease, partial [Bauldia sp.]|nr:rhomboid family intramembrane serine protease [Bauldia sp.]